MSEAHARSADGKRSEGPPCYGALDLGTNNCRLLIATPAGKGFRVVESFSRIVRLGDGLSRTGRLDAAAMDRAEAALAICADKLRRRQVTRLSAVATQACRAAANGPEFIARVEQRTGLRLRIISPEQEARLSVAGCLNLLDRDASAALVVDVGGGSTEMSWVDLSDRTLDFQAGRFSPERLPVRAWLSVPIGVVTLAEIFPEQPPASALWFRAMVDHVLTRIEAFTDADDLRPLFIAGRAHLVGTSGAITSLAGLHLGLRRYERSRVDGLWMRDSECAAVAEGLMALDPAERAAQPCIGPERADLVLAGAAILQAVQEAWPCRRVRVADRGLREGLLLTLMAEGPHATHRHRKASADSADVVR